MRRHRATVSRLPRHTFNLLTGVLGCAYLLHAWCHLLMRVAIGATLLTTVAFHGAHCVGCAELADARLMKYDVGTVLVTGACLVVLTDGAARCEVLLFDAVLLGAWLATFGPLRGLPFNPMQCLIHVGAVVQHVRAMRSLCVTVSVED